MDSDVNIFASTILIDLVRLPAARGITYVQNSRKTLLCSIACFTHDEKMRLGKED